MYRLAPDLRLCMVLKMKTAGLKNTNENDRKIGSSLAMQRVQTDDRLEQGGDHATNGAFNNLRVFCLYFLDNT